MLALVRAPPTADAGRLETNWGTRSLGPGSGLPGVDPPPPVPPPPVPPPPVPPPPVPPPPVPPPPPPPPPPLPAGVMWTATDRLTTLAPPPVTTTLNVVPSSASAREPVA